MNRRSFFGTLLALPLALAGWGAARRQPLRRLITLSAPLPDLSECEIRRIRAEFENVYTGDCRTGRLFVAAPDRKLPRREGV